MVIKDYSNRESSSSIEMTRLHLLASAGRGRRTRRVLVRFQRSIIKSVKRSRNRPPTGPTPAHGASVPITIPGDH